jgi:peptidoglycan/xylan/chitin deacetylase (PgdA/CDA1 family)
VNNWLPILAYHRICDIPRAGDPLGLCTRPSDLDRVLRYLRQRPYRFVSFDEAVDVMMGTRPRQGRQVCLTFDDGYSDNYHVVLPLLREAGVKADFFICPWNIENGRVFWWDKIALYMRMSRRRSVTLGYPGHIELDLSSPETVEAARHALLWEIKHAARPDIGRVLQELQQATGVELDEAAEARKLLMAWEHLRALKEAGMGVGSHSYSHPIFASGSEEAVREEMVRSKRDIEARLGGRVLALAYPTGRFSNGTKRLAQEAGYSLAYSYGTGASMLRSLDPYEIKRVNVERDMSLPCFRAITALPFLIS